MGKDPAFLFYSSDFYIGTMMMTDEQVGKYIRLLCIQHQHGHLSEKDMMKICVNHDEDIFSKFQKDDDGKYFNLRLETEADKRANFAQSRRDNRNKVNNSCTCVYLILNEDNGLVKIGSSNSPERRIIELRNQLETRNLTIIAQLKDINQTIEAEIHTKYKGKRSLNEWYSLNDKDISEIISHYDMNNHMIAHMDNEDEIENTSTDSTDNEPRVVPELPTKLPSTKGKKPKPEPVSFDTVISNFTDNQTLIEVINAFVEFRKTKGWDLTEYALKLILKKIKPFPDEQRIKFIETSIEKSYRGVFVDNNPQPAYQNKPTPNILKPMPDYSLDESTTERWAREDREKAEREKEAAK